MKILPVNFALILWTCRHKLATYLSLIYRVHIPPKEDEQILVLFQYHIGISGTFFIISVSADIGLKVEPIPILKNKKKSSGVTFINHSSPDMCNDTI